MKPTISKPFKSNDRTFDKVYNAFDKRDYFNSQGLAKTQIGNFERALQKNDKGAQQVLDLFKGDEKKAKDYITQVISDRNKERAFNNYKALKSAVDSIQKGKPNVGAVDYVKRIIHNSSQKYSIALYSTLRNKKFTKWKDVHNDIDSLIGESVNEILVIVDKFDKRKQDYGKVYYQDGGKRPGDGDINKAKKELAKLSKKHKGLTLISVGRNSKMYDVMDESVNESLSPKIMKLFKVKKHSDDYYPYLLYYKGNMVSGLRSNSKKEVETVIKSLLKPLGIKESVNEAKAFVVMYKVKKDLPNRNVKPSSAAYAKESDAKKFLKSVEKDGGKGMIVKSNVRGMKVNEAKYYNKADALTAYFKGKIDAKELDRIARDDFKSGIATKKELSNFLSNKFTQDVMSDTYGIPAGTLIKRVRGLMKFAEGKDDGVPQGYNPMVEDKKQIKDLVKKVKYEKIFYDVLSTMEKTYGKRKYRIWLEKSLKDFGENPKHYDYRTNAAAEEKLFQLGK